MGGTIPLVKANGARSSQLWNLSTILGLLFTAASSYWGYLSHHLELIAAVGGAGILSRMMEWTLPLMPLVGTVITPMRTYRPSDSRAITYGAIGRTCFSLAFMLLIFGMTLSQTGITGAIFPIAIVVLFAATVWTFMKARRIERAAGSAGRSASAG